MAVHLHKYPVSYFSVPKCACSSLKTLLFKAEHGFAWRDLSYGTETAYVHSLYPSLAFDQEMAARPAGNWTFAIVRDPIDRVLSAYRNRLMYHGREALIEASKRLNAKGLSVLPDVNEFLRNFEVYGRIVPNVRGHLKPLSHYLGTRPGAFDRIYDMSELPALLTDLDQRIPNLGPMPRMQTGGPRVTRDDLDATSRAWIEDRYAEDYEVFGPFFSCRQAPVTAIPRPAPNAGSVTLRG